MSPFLLPGHRTIIARNRRGGMVSKRRETSMCRPRIFSGMTALLLAQISCLPPTGGALGQIAEDKGTVTTTTPQRAACGPELQQYCSGVQPGQGRLIQCLNARQSDLSEACKTFVQLARQGCAPETGRTVRCI